MIEGEFEDAEGAEAIGFSHSDFGFVVQALNNATGEELLSAEIIEDHLAMLTQRPGDLFHGFDPGTHGLPAPLIEELRGPGLDHFRHDMETVETMQGLGAFLAHNFQIGFPHVRADKRDLGGDFFAYSGKKSLKGLDRSLLPDPQQTGDAEIDLINQRQVLVPFGVLDFIDPDGVDLTERAVLQSERDDMFDGVEDLVPE